MNKPNTPFAAAIHTDGSATSLDHLPPCDTNTDAAYIWTHLHINQEGAQEWLENEARLDPTVVAAMMAEDTRPRAVIKEDGALIVLRAINLNDGEPPEEMISLRMWIDERRVITTRQRNIKSISEIQKSLASGEAPPSPAAFLRSITSRIFARMEPFLEDLEDRIAAEEEKVVSGTEQNLGEGMFIIRRQVAIYRRYITPQKSVLTKLHQHQVPGLDTELQEHLGEELDRVTRFVEELDELASRSQLLNEEVRNIRGERLNDLTYVFSVAATIFLPLGFLTGIVGINLKGIPGENHPLGFWVFAGLCAALAAVMTAVFKKLKWF